MTVDARDRIHPRPHQIEAIAAITRALALKDRTLLVSACGTGKTLTARWYAQACEAQIIAVFVPSLALVAQTLSEWRKDAAAQWPYEALVVCSDQSTAAGAAERAAHEGGNVDRAFWSRVRAAVTTDPGRAAAALTRATRSAAGGRLVVFSTYHSAPVVAAALAASRTTLDLLIADEAHRLAGRPRDSFRTVLHDSQIPARKRLFMTATPQVSDADGALSLDDQDLFGPRAHTITFADAISAGLLADYQVLVIADNRVRDGRARRGDYDGAAVPGAVLAAASNHHLRSMLSFHTYVADARAFACLLEGITLRNGRKIHARHVTARHRGDQRARTLAWLGEDTSGGELRLVSSARCLAEGVDVPAVDSVLFADPRSAIVGIIQAVGRALRAAPGKTTATIIVPVTLPESGTDDDTDLTVSEFGHVWDVLRALKAHDERFAAELEQATEAMGRGRSRTGLGGARHHLHRVRFIIQPGVTLTEDMLTLRLVEAVSSDYGWERFYRLLCDYADSTGGAFLPINKTWNGVNLGGWAYRQAAVRKAGRMRADRAARLEAVAGWVWDREDGYFTEDLRRLRDLAASRPGGLTQPPDQPSIYKALKDSRGRPLGHRAADYRQLYRDEMLPHWQAQMLAAIPGWDWLAGLPADDIAMIQALRLFCEFARHADVPEAHEENGLPLGRWTYAVRRRKLTGRLHPALGEEIAAATPRGAKGEPAFRWLHHETQWRLAYSALRQFARREGHARVPPFHVEELPDATVMLGQWCSLQRFRKRRRQLDPQYVIWLNAIDGWEWDPAGRRQDYGEKLDLGDEKWHGRAKGFTAGCHCELCAEARRASDRRAKDRRDQQRMLSLGGAMPAGPARRNLARLERAGAGRALLATLTGVPLGVIRQVANGDTDLIGRRHDAAIAAVTIDMVRSAPTRPGSRGRDVTVGEQRIPSAATRAKITDLQRRGFGMSWITRELGYATTSFLGPDTSMVTRRVADQVADLHARAGDLVAPAHSRNQKVPPLARLLADARGGQRLAG